MLFWQLDTSWGRLWNLKDEKMPLSENMADNKWDIFLMIHVGESAQISVDDATPRQVVLGSTRKEAKQAKEEWTRQ